MREPINTTSAGGRTPRRHRVAGVLGVAALLLSGAVACSSDGGSGESASGPDAPAPLGPATAEATFDVQAGIGFVAVTDASPGTLLVLGDEEGTEVARGTVDRLGSLVFGDLDQGQTFTVRGRVGAKVAGSDPVETLTFGENPPQSFYDDLPEMTEGYQYLETRDGTTLALTVRAPIGRSFAEGPFPTLINMSGYADGDPESTPPMSLIASALGFATVSVNERGTGCSGGIGGLFDEIWAADGYDVVEAVAAQPWAAKVGLTGISFPGITQLFVAATNPPHLAAASPMSVLADVYPHPRLPRPASSTTASPRAGWPTGAATPSPHPKAARATP